MTNTPVIDVSLITKHKHGTAISAIPHQIAFYRELIGGAYKAGRLHLTFLVLNDKPVAYNLGVVSNGCYYYLKTSFNEAYRHLGVASVCRARLIRMLIDEGLENFDFPGEPYEWEKQWTRNLRWHRSFTIYNKTSMGYLIRMITYVTHFLRRSSINREVVYHDPNTIKPPPRGNY